jgi:hypothetical protein
VVVRGRVAIGADSIDGEFIYDGFLQSQTSVTVKESVHMQSILEPFRSDPMTSTVEDKSFSRGNIMPI